MMESLGENDLLRRVLEGIPAEIELFGSCAESSRVIRRGGVIASVCPAAPERSLFNSVYAEDPADLEPALGELAATYARASVRAWTVWLPGGHAAGPELLEPAGHVLDGEPRAMALDLEDLRTPSAELPDGVQLLGGDVRQVGQVNDRAYDMGPGWAAALTRPPAMPAHWTVAVTGGEPVACAAAIDVGEDTEITAVATLPEWRGRGLAGRIVHALLSEARDRGARTGSLQASKAGAPVYERLGFRDVGHVELWERRGSR